MSESETNARPLTPAERANLRQWLVKNGRWNKFNTSRTGKAKRLQDEGMPKHRAQAEAAWWAMSKHNVPEQVLEDPEYVPIQPPDLIRDAAWVYNNLRTKPKQEDAPSPGAWNLLQFALNPKTHEKFMSQYLPRVLQKQKKEEEEASGGTLLITKHDQDLIDEIRRMILEATK